MKGNCLVCKSKDWKVIYNNTLLKCQSCGFVTANMEIDPEVLKNTYTENYFKGEEYVDYIRDKEILQHNFKKRLKSILKKVEKKNLKNALEIGCAYGFFAEVFTKELPHAGYTGYDIVDEAIKYGRQVLKQNVICEDYLETISAGKYTDAFMWDVIEHLPNPQKFIEKISKEIETGGRLYITTGDIERFIPKMQKEKWRMIHPPSHLQYFSKKTITQLLNNYGFKVIHVSYPPVGRSIKLIYYSLFMLRKRYPKFVEKIYNHIPSKLNIALNTFDIMFVIAEKK